MNNNKIIHREKLGGNNYLIEITAPAIAEKYQPGQFVIIRINEKGERIPLTISDVDKNKGTIQLVFQVVGKTTESLAKLNEGDLILDCVGPLGNPSEIKKFGRVVCIGGGTGIACIFPIIRALNNANNEVISIIGARTACLLVFEQEIKSISKELHITTDDGTRGEKGFVTSILEDILKRPDFLIDRVIAIGPPLMMRAVAQKTKPYKIKTVVSLNTIMVDGTGMCGSCRVFVDGEMKLACIDGPEFDAHKVNFDDLINRLQMFQIKEKISLEHYKKRCQNND